MNCVYKPNIDKNLTPVQIPNEKIISSVLSEKSRKICSDRKMNPEERWELLKAQVTGHVIRGTIPSGISEYRRGRMELWVDVLDMILELEEK